MEILQRLIRERLGMEVSFGAGTVCYRETIANAVEGIGHFEPLRHYAEVHLLLEPGEPGSGVTVASVCPTDELNLNWQRLILTHLLEKEHCGVLTGVRGLCRRRTCCWSRGTASGWSFPPNRWAAP